jgi:hypothetical protein
MKNLKLFILAILLCAPLSGVYAAVNNVTYKIVYNPSTCLYDVFMTVTNGSTTSIFEQEAYNAQVSIVVPSGTTVGTTSITSNEPKTGSYSGTTLTRTTATGWSYTNSNSWTSGSSNVTVYAFTPNLSNAYWPSLSTGSSVLLFSLPISTTTCGSGIRMWNNNIINGTSVAGGDPSSSTSGFNGKDYNNGVNFSDDLSFNLIQAYSGNGTSSTAPVSPTIASTNLTISGGNINGTASVSQSGSCATISSYTWTSPAGGGFTYTSTTSPSFTRAALTANYGAYTLTVTNSLGCTATALATVALPIKLLSFTGTANKCNADLRWQIASTDKDAARFEVQYSADGARFATVGTLDRNTYEDSYSFSYTQPSGRGFYRLKISEVGGKATYSEIVSVNTECAAPDITIAPNPTASYSTVNGIEPGDQIKVTDMLGNVIANYVSGGSRATIELSNLPAAVYNIIISRNTEVIKAAKLTKL